MRSAADEIKDLLEDVTDLVFGQTLFVGREPATPNNVVTLYDTGGAPHLTLDNTVYEYTTIQVRVRNVSYPAAMERAYGIMTELHGHTGPIDSMSDHQLIRCIGGPSLLEYDATGRTVVVSNYELQRR